MAEYCPRFLELRITHLVMAENCPRFSELRITHLVDTKLKKANESWFSEIIITHWSVHMDFIPPPLPKTNHQTLQLPLPAIQMKRPAPLSILFCSIIFMGNYWDVHTDVFWWDAQVGLIFFGKIAVMSFPLLSSKRCPHPHFFFLHHFFGN